MIRGNRPIVETFVGADGLAIEFELKQEDGTAFNITSYTLRFTATLNGTVKINAVTPTKTNEAGGLASYTPTAAEINATGDYDAKLELILSTKIRRAEDFILRVNP